MFSKIIQIVLRSSNVVFKMRLLEFLTIIDHHISVTIVLLPVTFCQKKIRITKFHSFKISLQNVLNWFWPYHTLFSELTKKFVKTKTYNDPEKVILNFSLILLKRGSLREVSKFLFNHDNLTAHSLHWGIKPPPSSPQNHYLTSFLPSPPLNMQIV